MSRTFDLSPGQDVYLRTPMGLALCEVVKVGDEVTVRLSLVGLRGAVTVEVIGNEGQPIGLEARSISKHAG